MRIRSIKPEIYSDEKVSRWPIHDRWLFAGLISLADDYGIIRNQPKLIAGTIFPEDDGIGSREIHEALMRLSTDGPVILYEVDGIPYIALRNWAKHQRVQHPGKAKLPHPPEEALRPLMKPSRVSHETLIKSSPLNREQGTGNREHIKQTPQTPQGAGCSEEVGVLLSYWNSQSGQRRRRKAFGKLVTPRLKEGFSVDDIKQVIDWIFFSREMGAKYVRDNGYDCPETVLRPSKFEKYLDLANKASRALKVVESSKPDGWVGPAIGSVL